MSSYNKNDNVNMASQGDDDRNNGQGLGPVVNKATLWLKDLVCGVIGGGGGGCGGGGGRDW